MSLVPKKENQFYLDIANVFKDPAVRDFFEKYFSDPLDAKLMIKISKLIIFCCKGYTEQTGKELDMEVMTSIIHNTLTNAESRRKLLFDSEFEKLISFKKRDTLEFNGTSNSS